MTTAELQAPLLETNEQIDNQSPHDHDAPVHVRQARGTLSILLASSFPLICTSLLQSMQVGIALLFVGHIGKEELAAVSLATLTANVTGWSVFQGLASALDTLCPQAYGAGLPKMVGLYTQRMAILLFCVSLPISLFWCVDTSAPR
jgi:MATE family multidrug resistance protein